MDVPLPNQQNPSEQRPPERDPFADLRIRLWDALTQPQSQDEDQARREYITRVILLGVSVVILPFTLLAILGWSLRLIPIDTLYLMGGMSALFPFGLWLSHHGHWRISRYFPIGMVVLSAIFGSYVGGIDAPAQILYALAILLLGILVGNRGLFFGLALSLVSFLGFGGMHLTGLLPESRTAATMSINRITIVTATLTTITLTVWFLIAQYQKAILQARVHAAELTSLFETVTDGIGIFNLAGEVVDANPTFVRLHGYHDLNMLIGVNREKLVVAEDYPLLEDSIHRILEQGGGRQVEYRGLRRDGASFFAETSFAPLRDPDGRIHRMVGVVRDATPQRLLQTDLRRSEQRFRDLADLLPQIVYEVDGTGCLQYVNRCGLEIFGYPSEYAWAGFDMRDAVIPEDRDRLTQALVQLLAGNTISGEEYTGLRKDGTRFPIMAFSAPIFRDGRVDGARGILVDITERKCAEEEIRALNQELDERVRARTSQLEIANQDLEAFTYSVSHDLRAPVRHIKGFLRVFEEDFAEDIPPMVREMLDRIHRSADTMSALIDSLLALSRVARLTVHAEEVDLGTLAREIVDGLKRMDPARNVRFHAAKDLPVFADLSLMRTVLTNLLENAWKFSSHQSEADIAFGRQEAEGEWIFHVRDNGVGFDMGNAQKLFAPFQRLHTSTEFPGYGIGLATVRRIITLHGGRIWVEAAPGKGATFFFTIPSKESEEDTKRPNPSD
jgi:PAS domain S-box-containing protein